MDNIKALRLERGYNMKQVASALGLPYTTYVSYEKGDREPNSDVLIKIADFYNTTVDYVLAVSSTRETDSGYHSVPIETGKTLNDSTNISKLDNQEQQLLKSFRTLNSLGKEKVLENISDLIQIKKYTEKLYKIAARNGNFEERPLSDSEIEKLLNCPDVDDL